MRTNIINSEVNDLMVEIQKEANMFFAIAKLFDMATQKIEEERNVRHESNCKIVRN